jgi:hypothetical protein
VLRFLPRKKDRAVGELEMKPVTELAAEFWHAFLRVKHSVLGLHPRDRTRCLRRTKSMLHEDFTVILAVPAVMTVRFSAPSAAGGLASAKRTLILGLLNSLYH